MNAEIISIGAELIAGDIDNTDAGFLSQRLNQLGIRVTRHTAVDDTRESITEALAGAVTRSPIIIFTGGLGPTADDMTKEVVCSAVGMPLVDHPDSMKRLENYFNDKGMEMPEINRKQARFPEGAVVFPNTRGTADGCAIESGNQCILMLPGPPAELQAMFDNGVEAYLAEKSDSNSVCHTLKVFGIGESKVAERLSDLLTAKEPTVATYVGNGDLRIKISACGEDKQACEEKCQVAAKEIIARLGSCVYATSDISLPQKVVMLLKKQHKKVATAESCTAGMLSQMLTEVSGASDVFELGVSAYANRIKREVLNVPEKLLKKYGAVSPQVAEAMAKGAASKAPADFGIGITGIAGPTGGTPEKPVGLVYISLFDGKRYFTRKLNCGDRPRDRVRQMAAMNALDMLRLYLQGDPGFLKTVPAAKTPQKRKWWQNIFPVKGDKPADVIRKIIMIICVLVFLGSAIYIGNYFYESYMAKRNQSGLSEMFHAASINERFKKLLAINPETVGWLTVPGTQCDNPVVQSNNNNYYLNKNFERETSKYGTLFAEAVCSFEPEGLSDNTIIYGHHMKDGTMFGELKKLRKVDFVKQHPTVEFTSLYDTDTVQWKIVSVFIINTKTYDDEPLFLYRRVNFADDYSFMKYVDECRQRSMINTGVDVVYGDKLLTLSTCTYEFDDARLVVLARRVRDGESASVDATKIVKNPSPVYPSIYYKKTKTSGRTKVSSFSYSSKNKKKSSSTAAWSNTGKPGSTVSIPNENMWNSKSEEPEEDEESNTSAEPSGTTSHGGESTASSSAPSETSAPSEEQSAVSEPGEPSDEEPQISVE